ncbi:hypothetical protein PIB30_040860 [Stylosanthes scabra]|uniref:Uncharacterized protein n=1 Tax=Stylosanthes scabra TaxID=79078 RepID=A0ABU6REW6_9FABA|nr:hypothetical protein [Stylosanthes scabra]
MKKTNKANRVFSTGESLYIGGSITYSAIAKKMEEELGRPSTQSEVFTRTHTKKKDQRQWDDKRAEDTKQLYDEELKRFLEKRATLIATGCPEPPISEDEVWVRIAGGRKKGGPVDVREQVTLLNEELTQQAE